MIFEQTFGALGKGSVLFIRPPFVEAVAMNPFAPTLAFARRDHCLWMIVV
jgi:hypothetical protein